MSYLSTLVVVTLTLRCVLAGEEKDYVYKNEPYVSEYNPKGDKYEYNVKPTKYDYNAKPDKYDYNAKADYKTDKYEYKTYEYKNEYKKTTKCYQCAYSPPKPVYKEVAVPVLVKDHYGKTKAVYKTKLVAKEQPGGWDKCKGPFTPYEAKEYGIDVWECEDNCYTRVDHNGNIFRGCYRDEYGVDPEKIGCHHQAGSLYCFCKGHECNHEEAPKYSDDKSATHK